MARRLLAWTLVTPVAAAGIFLAHAFAYRLSGTDPGPLHEYLAHGPQVVGVLATIAIVGLACQQRTIATRSGWIFAVVAPVGFACQEHAERLAHTGQLPWLLTTPSFLLGLALQVPVALACVLVARRVAGTLGALRSPRPGLVGEVWLPLSERPTSVPRIVRRPRATGRAPPALLAT